MADNKGRAIIFGATSRMAEHVARILAADGRRLVLVARSEEKLEVLQKDLEARGATSVEVVCLDLSDLELVRNWFVREKATAGDIDTVLVAHGVLPEQEVVQDSWEAIHRSYDVNLLSPMCIVTEVVQIFEKNWTEKNQPGVLAVITSVAGDRARQSNYVYGAAKGALSLYLQGVRNRVGKTGIRIVDIRPGFVDTPMTAHIEKGPLFASAEVVAQGIVKAMQKGGDVVYLPWFWRYIMFIIRSIPESIFKRLSL